MNFSSDENTEPFSNTYEKVQRFRTPRIITRKKTKGEKMKNEKLKILVAGLIIGVIAGALVLFGNPDNMGFCIACFIRDTAGALGLHNAAAVEYIRPEIIGLVLGSFIVALITKEFKVRAGSAPLTRFVLGFCVMIGCLTFLGCPFRMILRLAGGDLNAFIGLLGFVAGIGCGTFFLKKGYSLKKTYVQNVGEGLIFPAVQVVLLILLIIAPAFILFTEAGGGPGAKHAAIIISLAAGLIVGAIAQRTRLCMAGGFRDLFLFKESRLIIGFAGIFVAALIFNLISGKFNLGFEGQPVAHNDYIFNFLGMLVVGFGSVLLGGCPLRQLIMAGEGNTDSVMAVLGLLVGAAFCHNFKLAASGEGTTPNGRIAVIIAIAVVAVIAVINTFVKKKEK